MAADAADVGRRARPFDFVNVTVDQGNAAMCGIFGIIWHRSEVVPAEDRLLRTAALLEHRGPDARGVYAEKGIGLAHTRLSLLDLNPRSNQPFWDASGRYVLVYNGEIYNFDELRAELERSGIQFRTTSDTEVLLEAVLYWGAEAALPRFEGMFAFGLYDTVEKSMLVARDLFGIKPIFIYDDGEAFIFASEVAALRPWVQFEPDFHSISAFLLGFSGPSRGATFYKNVVILDPGSFVRIVKGGQPSYRQFQSVESLVTPEETRRWREKPPRAWVDRVDALLNESIKSQLVADAPVGALCSGGIDSAIIVAIAAKYHNNLAIFHANVTGPLSEFAAAERLAKCLGLEMKSVEVTDADFIEKIPDVMVHYGHPFYPCPHSVPFLMVSRLIRHNQVKAVLSGEGADECFFGYQGLVPKLGTALGPRNLLRQVRGGWRTRRRQGSLPFQGLDYVRGGDGSSDSALVHAMHNRLEVFEEALSSRERLKHIEDDSSYRSAVTTMDLLHYNLRALLHRNDCMGMAASIESRFPYLDSRLVGTTLNLPYESKIRFTPGFRVPSTWYTDKWVLREVGKRYLPNTIARREKKPFPTNAYSNRRLVIGDAFFKKSFVTELFSLSNRQMDCVLTHASHDLKWKMVQVDVWAQVSLLGCPRSNAAAKISAHLEIKRPA